MTDSIWNDLCQQPVITASTEKYTTLVTNATTQLRQPIDSIMTTLNERAMGLSKCANFEAALRDANTMQQLSPFSPLGYLRAADIYNEQGKRRPAIGTCNKGLNVVDTNDPFYATLQRAKEDAEHHASKRVDFIRELPIDIVTTTVIPMLVDDPPLQSLTPCPYLHVSNLWRDYILQSTNGLRFEIGDKEEEEDPEKCSQLIRFSRHIKSLHVRQYSKGTWLSDLFSRNDFSSLRELCIDGISTGAIDDFARSLRSISNTLTHLTIHEGHHGTLSILEILTTCTNLVSLTMSEHQVGDFSSLPKTTWPNMTALSIEVSNEGLTGDEAINLAKCFPSLQKFQLRTCTDIKSALMIPQYCTLLKSVELDIYFSFVGVCYTSQSTGCDELAITKLGVYYQDWDEGNQLVDIGSILKQHHESLEQVVWDVAPDIAFHDLDDVQYPRLKKLSLWSSGSWLPRKAYMVEELEMTSMSINAYPSMLDTIPLHLKKLELMFDVGHEIADHDAVVRYIHGVAQQCLLHELSIRFKNPQTYDDVLDAIPIFNQLERLMIGVRGKWNAYQMERFLDQVVNGCPYLRCLELDCMNPPSTYSLGSLKRLRHLKSFAFSIEDTDGYDSFWHALRTFSQLSCIRLHPTIAVTKYVMRHLKVLRRGMKVIVDESFNGF